MMDRKLIVNELMQYCDSLDENCPVILLDSLALLKEQPQIVRCKDCKHYKDGKCFYTMRRHGLKDDWFCADGERK